MLNVNKGQCRVEIYFGSPTDHGRQVLRPFEYRLSENHLDELRSPSTKIMGDMRTMDGTDFSGVILPSVRATDIRTATFNELYRFTMIVFTPRIVGSPGQIGQRESVQTYTGYMYDQPYTLDMSGQISSLNHEATMLITNSVDMLNYTGNRLQTQRAVDVAHAPLANQTDNTLYRCDITQLAPDRTVFEDSTFGGMTPHRALNADDVGTTASIKRNSIDRQLGIIAAGISRSETLRDSRMISNGVGMSGFQLHDEGVSNDDAIRDAFASGVGDRGTSLRTTGIDVTSEILTLGEIIDSYGAECVHVQTVADILRDWDVINPTLSTVESQASVVVTSAIRDICTTLRLRSLGFIYASNKLLVKDDGLGRGNGFTVGDIANDSHFELTSIEPWIEMEADRTLLQQHMQIIHSELDTRVAPILASLSNGDDFVVLVENRSTDRCLTRVTFAGNDYGARHHGYFESPTRLAGLTAPIVGSHQAMTANTDAVGRIMDIVAASNLEAMDDYREYAEIDDSMDGDLDLIY